MPGPSLWFLLLFASVATLMMAMAVPLIRGRVRRNALYGVRTPKTLRDEGTWSEANTYGGRLLFGTGLVDLVAVVALYLVPRFRADFVAYNIACGAVILGGLVVSGGLLMRRLRTL